MSEDRDTLLVVDDFPDEISIGAAELDTLEAFLMPIVNAILRGELPGNHNDGHAVRSTAARDSQAPQKAG